MQKDDEDEQDSTRDGRDGEEIRRSLEFHAVRVATLACYLPARATDADPMEALRLEQTSAP